MKNLFFILTSIFSFGTFFTQAQDNEEIDKGLGFFNEGNYEEAFDWFKKAAENGNKDAEKALERLQQTK